MGFYSEPGWNWQLGKRGGRCLEQNRRKFWRQCMAMQALVTLECQRLSTIFVKPSTGGGWGEMLQTFAGIVTDVHPAKGLKARQTHTRETQIRPSYNQMEKRDSSLQKTHFYLHLCIQCFALHLVMCGLDAAAQPWKIIPWSSLCYNNTDSWLWNI